MHIQSETNNCSSVCRGVRDKRETVSVVLPEQFLVDNALMSVYQVIMTHKTPALNHVYTV